MDGNLTMAVTCDGNNDGLQEIQDSFEDKLRKLQDELDECRSLVTIAECEKENVIETEQRKCQEEVASVQRIMEERIGEAVRGTTSRFEKEISQLQKTNEKLESELAELRSQAVRDRIDITREGVLAAVTKSLKRVGNLGSPLPFTASSGDSVENLEESMRKAQEDAEMLRSLVVPLEEEIKALKDKLRSTDEQLRMYETAFSGLVKGLGSDSLSEIMKGKSPAEVVEHLDEKLTSLSQGLQAEKASRSDLEMYVAVLNTQKAVMQEDMDRIKQELQEVCHLLEKEKKEHALLKRTWQMANDQFLETQRLQIIDMTRIQNVLTSEQQRQIAEIKKRDEERLQLQKQAQRMEQLEKSTEKENEVPLVEKARLSPLSSPSVTKGMGRSSSPTTPRRPHSNNRKIAEVKEEIPTGSVRARSIPADLNHAGAELLSEKRSLSSSAINRVSSPSKLKSRDLSIQISPPESDVASPSDKATTKKPHSLTQDQVKALSDLTPELEVRKTLLDSARAEAESFSLVGKRLVSESEWQLLEEELRKAREKLGQPCEMCNNYELQLQQVQRMEQEQKHRASTAEQMLKDYKKDLQQEQAYREEMEQKFTEGSKESEIKVNDLFKKQEESEKILSQIRKDYESCCKEFVEYQKKFGAERESLKSDLTRLQNDNKMLLGKHIAKAQQMTNEDIDLPNSLEDLQFYCLQKQEELITTVAAKESMEESLRSEIQMLKNQIMSEQTAKESLEDTLTQEIDTLREQLGILESVKEELESVQKQKEGTDQKCGTLQEQISQRLEEKTELQKQLDDIMTAKLKSDEEIRELKSKVQGLQSDLDNSEAVQRDFVKLSQSLQMELEKIRQSDSEVRWQHDEDVPECNACKKQFQSRKEKSHCSHCGKVFCAECLSKTVCSGPKGRSFKVCNVCHTLLDHQTAPYFSSEPPQTPS